MTFYLKTGLIGAKQIITDRLFLELLLDTNDHKRLMILHHENLANNYIHSSFRDHPSTININSINEDLTLKYDTNRFYSNDEIEFYSIYYVIKLVNGEIIGSVDLYGDSKIVELGIFIDRNHSGKKYGTEAIQSIIEFLRKNSTIQKLKWECDINNVGSISIAQKCGFIYNGNSEIYPGRQCYVFYLNLQ